MPLNLKRLLLSNEQTGSDYTKTMMIIANTNILNTLNFLLLHFVDGAEKRKAQILALSKVLSKANDKLSVSGLVEVEELPLATILLSSMYLQNPDCKRNWKYCLSSKSDHYDLGRRTSRMKIMDNLISSQTC
eukprot:snap_masked-scaffold_29-processed-gene-1.28-mRNA-1 protein AED:1.00 eAED:1.00 QI:0/-1/0/0/-1/1/1/0/131